MPSPFPGMDPYLEDPAHWPDVHHGLIAIIREELNRHIRPRYVARVEERTFYPEADDPGLSLYIPDVRIEATGRRGAKFKNRTAVPEPLVTVTLHENGLREARVEIVEVNTRDVVTVIEVLSPSNKLAGSASRQSFVEKRNEVMGSTVHWVEIDLLRGLSAVELFIHRRFDPHDYCVHVSPVELRPQGRIWLIQLDQVLPTIGIPLRQPDSDVPLNLQHILATAYERGAYDATIDYSRDAIPPLSDSQAKWAKTLLPKRKRK